MFDVHRLTPDEWTLWRDVRLAALSEAPDAFGEVLADWSDADETRWRERLDELPLRAIAFRHDEPVGQIAALAPDDAGHVKLIAMWVAPNARGQRVSEALITEVVDWARSQEAVEVFLYVWPTNTAAIRLYERFGFTQSTKHVSPVRREVRAYELPLR